MLPGIRGFQTEITHSMIMAYHFQFYQQQRQHGNNMQMMQQYAFAAQQMGYASSPYYVGQATTGPAGATDPFGQPMIYSKSTLSSFLEYFRDSLFFRPVDASILFLSERRRSLDVPDIDSDSFQRRCSRWCVQWQPEWSTTAIVGREWNQCSWISARAWGSECFFVAWCTGP